MISRRSFLGSTLLSALFGLSPPAFSARTGSVPWRNWSGGQMSHPARRFSPAGEEQLAAFFKSSVGTVRPVGSGHSFTPLVPTDGTLLIIDQLDGLLDHDAVNHTATFGAGTRLGDMGAPLQSVNQAMINLPDIDRQTLAGATATATHGTGISFKCLSGYITGFRLVTPDGEIRDISANADPELFDAGRVSLGALGVITRMTIQNQPAYRLKQRSWIEKTDILLQAFDHLATNHRHFEIFPLPHSDYSLALATDETDEPIHNPPSSPEEEAALDLAMQGWTKVPPSLRGPIVNALAEQVSPSEKVDESYKVLTNIRNTRFNEMEYSIPLAAGADCLQEILATIIDSELDVVFPLEYRYVSKDDTMLSMSSGDEDHVAISIHRLASEDYRPYFNVIEPIFWKYGGRPHWGKIHSLRARQLELLYPRFNEFRAIRARLDPGGRMLNNHLRSLFGENSY